MLCGRHFVVLSGGGDAELPQLNVQVVHECTNPFADLAEVVVIQLLPLGSGSTK